MELARYDGWRALRWGSVISALIAIVVLALDTPQSPLFLDWRGHGAANPLHPAFAMISSILVGMGVGSQLSLWSVNRHRWRAALRPNRGRVICGLLLVLLCPFAQVLFLPVTLLFRVVILSTGCFALLSEGLLLLLVLAVLFPVGYFFAS